MLVTVVQKKQQHVKAPVEKLVGADINNFNLKKDRRNNKLLWFKGKLYGQLFDLLLHCGTSTCCTAKRCVTSNHVLKKIPKLPYSGPMLVDVMEIH